MNFYNAINPPNFVAANFWQKISEPKGWYLQEIGGIWNFFYNEENLGFIDFA